jgi:hypothetical protein
MMRILQFFCSSLLLITLASCGNQTAPIENSAVPPAAPAAPTTTARSKSPGFVALQGVVASTTKAIESGKLDAAKIEFAKFENSWKTVEDSLKSKSPETYRAIEDGVKSIDRGIESKQGKDLLLASLKKLGLTIEQASTEQLK